MSQVDSWVLKSVLTVTKAKRGQDMDGAAKKEMRRVNKEIYKVFVMSLEHPCAGRRPTERNFGGL